jgi:hypothetical protein
MTRFISFTAFFVLLSGGAVAAQSPKAVAALIDQSIANADQNATAALAYTFHENYVGSTTTSTAVAQYGATILSPKVSRPTFTIGRNGDSESSVQYDVLFVKGVPFRRIAGINHQPLSPELAAAESKRYDAAVAAIHAMSDEQRLKMTKGSNSLMVDPRQLIDLYECNITGHEKVQKRPATVVQCRVRHDIPRQSDAAANLISTDIKLWIDDQQPFFVRTRAILNRSIDKDRKLTLLNIQWKLIDGVWHQISTEVAWVGPEGSGIRGKVVDSFSDFKRFRTEAKILPGYTPEVPLPPQP